jgi:hypothetical protein
MPIKEIFNLRFGATNRILFSYSKIKKVTMIE